MTPKGVMVERMHEHMCMCVCTFVHTCAGETVGTRVCLLCVCVCTNPQARVGFRYIKEMLSLDLAALLPPNSVSGLQQGLGLRLSLQNRSPTLSGQPWKLASGRRAVGPAVLMPHVHLQSSVPTQTRAGQPLSSPSGYSTPPPTHHPLPHPSHHTSSPLSRLPPQPAPLSTFCLAFPNSGQPSLLWDLIHPHLQFTCHLCGGGLKLQALISPTRPSSPPDPAQRAGPGLVGGQHPAPATSVPAQGGPSPGTSPPPACGTRSSPCSGAPTSHLRFTLSAPGHPADLAKGTSTHPETPTLVNPPSSQTS